MKKVMVTVISVIGSMGFISRIRVRKTILVNIRISTEGIVSYNLQGKLRQDHLHSYVLIPAQYTSRDEIFNVSSR